MAMDLLFVPRMDHKLSKEFGTDDFDSRANLCDTNSDSNTISVNTWSATKSHPEPSMELTGELTL
jgi:hypothetical protein